MGLYSPTRPRAIDISAYVGGDVIIEVSADVPGGMVVERMHPKKALEVADALLRAVRCGESSRVAL